ncbi:MAG: periplasmic heavy metal sensor [Asticcacaulis sp.]
MALNLFLIGGGVAAVAVIHNRIQIFSKHEFSRQMPGAGPGWDAVETRLTPQTRDHIRDVVKTAALGTENDWHKARDLRLQAEKLAGQPSYDVPRIIALAEQARSYENMSRARIETALIEDMANLPTDQRGAVASYVLHPGFRLHRLLAPDPNGHGPDGHDQPPPAASGAASK